MIEESRSAPGTMHIVHDPAPWNLYTTESTYDELVQHFVRGGKHTIEVQECAREMWKIMNGEYPVTKSGNSDSSTPRNHDEHREYSSGTEDYTTTSSFYDEGQTNSDRNHIFSSPKGMDGFESRVFPEVVSPGWNEYINMSDQSYHETLLESLFGSCGRAERETGRTYKKYSRYHDEYFTTPEPTGLGDGRYEYHRNGFDSHFDEGYSKYHNPQTGTFRKVQEFVYGDFTGSPSRKSRHNHVHPDNYHADRSREPRNHDNFPGYNSNSSSYNGSQNFHGSQDYQPRSQNSFWGPIYKQADYSHPDDQKYGQVPMHSTPYDSSNRRSDDPSSYYRKEYGKSRSQYAEPKRSEDRKHPKGPNHVWSPPQIISPRRPRRQDTRHRRERYRY